MQGTLKDNPMEPKPITSGKEETFLFFNSLEQ